MVAAVAPSWNLLSDRLVAQIYSQYLVTNKRATGMILEVHGLWLPRKCCRRKLRTEEEHFHSLRWWPAHMTRLFFRFSLHNGVSELTLDPSQPPARGKACHQNGSQSQ